MILFPIFTKSNILKWVVLNSNQYFETTYKLYGITEKLRSMLIGIFMIEAIQFFLNLLSSLCSSYIISHFLI
jgi:hypothetical protein